MLRLTSVLIVLATPLAAEVPHVVVDVPPVHSLVAQVMEGVGTPELILPPGTSPHDAALRPSDAEGLARADFVIWIGPELSSAITRSVDALASGTILELLDVPGTRTLSFREGPVFEHDEHEHEEHEHDEHADDDHGAEDDDDHEVEGDDHDHDHDGRDPHAWLDPVNASLWVTEITRQLADMDPENAGTYLNNADDILARLDTLLNEIDTRITPLRGQPFIVFHDAYHYFEARFGIEAAGAIALGDGASPGPRRLAEIGQVVQDLNVTCVFAEPQFNADYVAATVSDAGARIGEIDPLGSVLTPGIQLYEELMLGIVTSFEDCLSTP